MKNKVTALGTALLFLATTINFYCQDIAMINIDKTSTEIYSNETEVANTVLKNGTYTYKLGANDIIVSIKGGYYTEYHPNDEFIKAEINWTSESEYTLTIVDLKRKNIPFKEGTTLNTKITKVKGDKYYYRSDLLNSGDSSWTGKFRKVAENFSDK